MKSSYRLQAEGQLDGWVEVDKLGVIWLLNTSFVLLKQFKFNVRAPTAVLRSHEHLTSSGTGESRDIFRPEKKINMSHSHSFDYPSTYHTPNLLSLSNVNICSMGVKVNVYWPAFIDCNRNCGWYLFLKFTDYLFLQTLSTHIIYFLPNMICLVLMV